ncbi:hypothetical protein RyT2_18390 [Pseudolactococcus yaeyamensis]
MKHKKNIQVLLDVAILILLVTASVFSVIEAYPLGVSILFISLSFILLIWLLTRRFNRYYSKRFIQSKLKNMLLIGENGEIIKTWHISGERALVIGKSYKNNSVDIDLSDSDYAVLIGKEHAVMNCIEGKWFIEDLGTRNGTGIKSKDETKIYRLTNLPYELAAQDCIYIAKTKLLVQ